MKLEVGMYVRTEEGKIFKTDGDLIYLSNDKTILYRLITRVPHDSVSYKVVKASFNIIDLIEVGDILVDDTNRKLEVLLIDNELMVMNTGLIYDNNYYLSIEDIKIKSIVTHQQFERMSYKLGE